EDAEFLVRHRALADGRIRAVETGGCPHAAIREDISHNLVALEDLMDAFRPDLLFVESGGDNLAAQFSRELVDYTIYVIDASGGARRRGSRRHGARRAHDARRWTRRLRAGPPRRRRRADRRPCRRRLAAGAGRGLIVDLRQLEILQAIAETGSFSACGRKLHV